MGIVWFVVRFLVNWAIKAGLLLLFNYVGWIKLHPAAELHTVQDTLITAALIGLLFALIHFIVLRVSMFACCFFIVLLPFIGYFTLNMIEAASPDFLELTSPWWAVAIMGLVMGIVGIPEQIRPKTQDSDWVYDD